MSCCLVKRRESTNPGFSSRRSLGCTQDAVEREWPFLYPDKVSMAYGLDAAEEGFERFKPYGCLWQSSSGARSFAYSPMVRSTTTRSCGLRSSCCDGKNAICLARRWSMRQASEQLKGGGFERFKPRDQLIEFAADLCAFCSTQIRDGFHDAALDREGRPSRPGAAMVHDSSRLHHRAMQRT